MNEMMKKLLARRDELEKDVLDMTEGGKGNYSKLLITRKNLELTKKLIVDLEKRLAKAKNLPKNYVLGEFF